MFLGLPRSREEVRLRYYDSAGGIRVQGFHRFEGVSGVFRSVDGAYRIPSAMAPVGYVNAKTPLRATSRSSFDRSVWPLLGPVLPSLPEPVYENLPLALSPVLIDLEKGAQTTLAAVPCTHIRGIFNAVHPYQRCFPLCTPISEVFLML